MSSPSANKELLNQLKEKTKENLNNLREKGLIYKEDQLQKNYTVNKPMEYQNNSNKKPIPLNIIYHTLYDQETPCQSSNGKLTFNRHIFSLHKDYDIKFDKKTLDNSSLPNFFKMTIEESVKNYIDSNNSIQDKIDDLNSNYPKIFEFQYNYQHPIPKPVFMGPKLLLNTDSYKIIFVSPICLILEIKGESGGFAGLDCFYSAIKYKYDMELNDDLTLKKTLFNSYFGINFVKSSWLKGKITSSAFEQADEGFNGFYMPLIVKELNATIKKHFKAPPIKKIMLKDKNINSRDLSITADDLIINDSFISDIEDDNGKYRNNNNFQSNNDNKGLLFNYFYLVLLFIGIFSTYKFIGKDFLIIILIAIVIYYLFLINNKLDKLCISKHI